MRNTLIFTFLLIINLPLCGKTIAEKKATIQEQVSDLDGEMQRALIDTNATVHEKQVALNSLYEQVWELHQAGAGEESYKDLLDQVNLARKQIIKTQEGFRNVAKGDNSKSGYALWHQPDTTIGQLVIDYGSQEFVYLLTPDIAQTKISVSSNLPIPTASWDEMLTLILSQNGIGVKQINPYLRQLVKISDDRSGIKLVTNNSSELHLLSPETRVAYVITPEPADARRIWIFLEKFINPNSASIQMVGGDIFIVATVGELQDLLKLHDFVATNRGDKDYKIVALKRVRADEMAKILSALFETFQTSAPQKDPKVKKAAELAETSGLKVITLANALQAVFLVGTQDEITKAEEVIREVENQVGGAVEKVIHWYTVKHSDPEDLAKVMAKVYTLMVKSGTGRKGGDFTLEELDRAISDMQVEDCDPGCIPPPPCPGGGPYDCGYFLDDRFIVNDDSRCGNNSDPNRGRSNFIVDPKSNSIVMVVEADHLGQIKELIKKLDVPKKMVQIEVLLFEKKLKRENDFGLNLLKIGTKASDTHSSSACWNDTAANRGIFQYLLSREKGNGGLPAFDLIYKFLMTQDDITINATPSVIALNQTKAKIQVEEEISVNTGVFEIPTEGAVALKDSFARARYGIKIEITPTIHLPDDDACHEKAYVTMDTNVIFETFDKKASVNPKQPDVTRRVICNEVRVADGESVILGGLRRKITEDKKEMIPFIGELPGLGKLFSMTEMEDSSTEMYIFITPRIIHSPYEDAQRLRTRELCRRPGDIPSFLGHLVKAREYEESRMMTGAMDMLFGRERDRIEIPCGEFDGRCHR